MSVHKPHYLLFSKAKRGDDQGGWSFVLTAADGSATFHAEDNEPDTYGERLELLAVVRGLEALDQPSKVTLVTPSRYVNLGLSYGLDEWRRNGWTWECFGQMVPIKNRDLWQRLDRALHFHQLHAKTWRLDEAHLLDATAPRETHHEADTFQPEYRLPRRRRSGDWRRAARRGWLRVARWIGERLQRWQHTGALFGLGSSPWLHS